MNEKLRKTLFVLLAAVFAVSTGMLVLQFLDNAGGEETYSEAKAIASGNGTRKETEAPEETAEETLPVQTVWIPAPVEDDPVMEEMAAIDLAALREVNADVIGWIRVPDTKIDYPIIQGQDNDFYLKHTWDKQQNSVGSIFLEYLNSPDFTDYNTIVYGHNMRDGSMFAQLHKFTNQEFWAAHPYVYIVLDSGVYRYDIFAAYRAEVDSVVYGLNFLQNRTKRQFLQHAAENTQIQTNVTVTEQDRVITLSTCSGVGYENRWVVQARLKMVEAER